MKRRPSSHSSLFDPASQRSGVTRRVLAAGLIAAGLYVGTLAPSGAMAQDPTPSSSPTEAPTVQLEQTPESSPTSEPTQEPTPESTATTTPEPTSSPSESPTGTPSPEPSAEPTPVPLESPTATAVPEATVDAGADVGTELDAGGDMDFEQAVDVGEFTIDLDDPNTDATHGINGLPECTPELIAKAKRAARKAKSSKGDKDSTSDRAFDCVTRTTREKKTTEIRNSDGTPTLDNPTISIADLGPAPVGVPNFFIEKFRIPPFLLPIYQAAGMQYGIRWEVLAAINEIETDYGRNLNVSSAGALGWMQFMPATWKAYGVDANKDGLKDPFNPVDAIFAAARYLRAAGAETDLYKAIFAYNHADWYVDSVLMRARLIGGLPSNFVGSLTGLTQARFPVHAKARYAGDISEREAKRKTKQGANAAYAVESQSGRRGIQIFARRGAPVIAVNDGRIVRMGKTKRLGNYVQLQDVYGNVFTYAHLSKVAETYPAPRERKVTGAQIARELKLPAPDAKPKQPATAGSKRKARTASSDEGGFLAEETVDTETGFMASEEAVAAAEEADPLGVGTGSKERLFAHPTRPAAASAGAEVQLASASYKPTIATSLRLKRSDYEPKQLKKGARIIAGTVLGRIGRTSSRVAPHVLFEIRPAGRGAPRIDPKPILDGWKLLESTEIYRAEGKNSFFGPDAKTASIGQILLMSKELLMQRVLANPRIEIYGCGRQDVRIGAIDRRVLATLEFLASSGLKPTVTSLRCGHGFYTASGNVSHHSSGNAVDIAAVNGIPIIGNQGEGSITEMAVQRLLTLQGTMRPAQIISLMKFDGADNTFAMGDHNDHIHVGFRPLYGANSRASKEANSVLKPKQWIKLIDRLKQIDNPTVRQGPSKYAVEVPGAHGLEETHDPHKRASSSHKGE